MTYQIFDTFDTESINTNVVKVVSDHLDDHEIKIRRLKFQSVFRPEEPHSVFFCDLKVNLSPVFSENRLQCNEKAPRLTVPYVIVS